MNFLNDLSNFVKKHHPFWSDVFAPQENTVSSAVVELKDSTFQNIQKFVTNIYKLRNNKNYVTSILKKYPNLTEQKHLSVLMSFDFHIVDDKPKLIEINTNASFCLVAYLVNEFHNISSLSRHFLPDLKASFENDFNLFNGSKNIKKIAIVDKNPAEQKAYFEFLLYQALFEHWGWNSKILDVSQFDANMGFDFIYNRHTDFYLTDSESQKLNEVYKNKTACLSPNPTEYALLGDKNRLIDFSNKIFLKNFLTEKEADQVLEILPNTLDFETEDRELLWENRKKLFFKPKSSFGGKATYKGESVSRKKFDEFDSSQFIAQEYVPPGTIELNSDTFKWDLRCYVYDGKIQMVSARVYKGQVTNFREPGGGIAAVKI